MALSERLLTAATTTEFICWILFAVSRLESARPRISSATTAKPFPASPALAASMLAFNASRLVWLDIFKISSVRLVTCPTLWLSSIAFPSPSNIIPMVSLDSYIQVYDAATKTAILIAKNILESTNLVLFIMFLIVYIANQIRENENISKELSMINEVNKQLKDYAAVTEKIGESNERKRLAREIHDTLGHALTGIAAGIDACIAMIDIDPNVTKQQLLVVSKVVREGISDVRRSLNKLRPGALEEHTLKEAIQKMIKEFSDVSEVEIMLDYQLDKVDFENTKEDIIFRIVQESITNALRHGRAKKVEINIYQRVSDLEIVIADNGVGCDDLKLGYGLKQMQERAAILNGRLEYYSKEGFTVKVTIPMKEGERYD